MDVLSQSIDQSSDIFLKDGIFYPYPKEYEITLKQVPKNIIYCYKQSNCQQQEDVDDSYKASTVPEIINDSIFEKRLLEHKIPVLVYFFAAYFSPCLTMNPIVDNIAEQFGGRIAVYKMNIYDNPVTSSKYDINTIPTLTLFKDGQLLDQYKGVHEQKALIKKIKDMVS